ncbi:MAG TPA: SRPBCC family protein [Pilimelia sp.]|nr:SRPBCC family protein [Pilimelia sp.]
MPTITNTIAIKANPDEVWRVLSDMPGTRYWLPGVVAADMAGDVRICRMADGEDVHEQISDVAPDRRSYRFEHLRVPLPVRQSGGSFAVTAGPDPGTATVTLTTTFEPLDPTGADQLTGMIHGVFQQSLESLRRFVEDALPWDAD